MNTSIRKDYSSETASNHSLIFFQTNIMTSVFRPAIDTLAGYTPGEQPQESGWIKLNTNENPYPPSPRVIDAIRRSAEGRLNVYPDPRATQFRRVAADLFQVDPDWILPANGSDENLTIITRSFCDAGDLIDMELNLETDTSEIDNVLITSGTFYYQTTHTGVESGDT